MKDYLAERKSPYQASVAFSGKHDYGGVKVSEASLNRCPSGQIKDKIQEDPYRFLVCADKFQTGYDEPVAHDVRGQAVSAGHKRVENCSWSTPYTGTIYIHASSKLDRAAISWLKREVLITPPTKFVRGAV